MKNHDSDLIEVIDIRIIKQLVSRNKLKDLEKEGTKEELKSTRLNGALWIKIPNKERLKRNISILLDRHNLSYALLARLAGVTRERLYAITNVNNHTRRSVIENIAHAFGVSVQDLLMTDL